VIGGPLKPADRLERFRAWVEAFTGALESGDLDAIGRLFAIECSYQAGPFAPELKGRPAIRAHLVERLAAMPGLDSRAEILGVGTTYGVVHWSLAWGDRGPSERADGILLVALDPMGRGSAVREWTIGASPPSR
jgi:hypothetical protein